MKENNKQMSRREYLDEDGWKVLELTAPKFSIVFKTKENQCIYINNGKVIHQGFYDPAFDQLINSLFDGTGLKLTDNSIDLEEVGNTYKFIPKEEKTESQNAGSGCGCGCGCFCLFILACLGIFNLLGEIGQAIVHFITNLF